MLHIICCGSHTITPEVSLALRCEIYQCPASLFNEISSLVLRRDFGNTLANVRILVLIHQHRSKRIQQPTSPSIPSSRHVFPSTDVPRTYQLLRKKKPPPRSTHLFQAEKHSTILALTQHRINTLPALRRIERAFAALDTPDTTAPMTAAWTYYVSSHSLLTELRSLTRNYPFSSQCIEEAKRRVYADPESNRSWNLAWLVLVKMRNE